MQGGQKAVSLTIGAVLKDVDKAIDEGNVRSKLSKFTANGVGEAAFEITASQLTPYQRSVPFVEEQSKGPPKPDRLAILKLNSIALSKHETEGSPKASETPSKIGSRHTRKKGSEKVKKDLLPLSLNSPKLSKEDIEYQEKIKPIKNHFNNVLQFTKQFQKEVKERGDLLLAKKQAILPNKGSISYDFDGKMMPRNSVGVIQQSQHYPIRLKTNVDLPTLHHSHNLQPTKLNKPKNLQNSHRGDRINMRKTMNKVFNNENQRQVSHSPYINLSENVKLFERASLDGSIQSSKSKNHSQYERKQRNFKHHSQHDVAERIKSEPTEYFVEREHSRYTLEEPKTRSIMHESPESIKSYQSSHIDKIQRKKRMNRVQKAILKFQQSSRGMLKQLQKSRNFQRLNSPSHSPMNQFYRHDYNLSSTRPYDSLQYSPE